jgi:hypothetical protein
MLEPGLMAVDVPYKAERPRLRLRINSLGLTAADVPYKAERSPLH